MDWNGTETVPLLWEASNWLPDSEKKAGKGKGKAIPLQALRVGQEVEAPRFQDSRHMKVVRLSALRTGRFYAPGNIPGTHFC